MTHCILFVFRFCITNLCLNKNLYPRHIQQWKSAYSIYRRILIGVFSNIQQDKGITLYVYPKSITSGEVILLTDKHEENILES